MKTKRQSLKLKHSRWAARLCLPVLCCIVCLPAFALQEYVWTNKLGGSWHNPANWSPNIVPGVFGDNVYITNGGTYTVSVTNTVNHLDAGTIGGPSGTQTLRVGNGVTFNGGFWNIVSNGISIFTNSTFSGILLNRTNGRVVLSGADSKTLNNVVIHNWGTVSWEGGLLTFIDSGVINNGLWEIAGDNFAQFFGATFWTNNGVLRKISGAGETRFSSINFVNSPGALVDAQTGLLNYLGGPTNLIGGTFNAAAGATNSFTEGTWFDSGGVCTGSGLNQFYGATLNLRTNNIAGLKLVANNVVIGTNFQQGGVITNLTLDGATLFGTNRVGNGMLTVNAGRLGSALTVQSSGELLLGTTGSKNFSGLSLINQGRVLWTGGTIDNLNSVSNGGLWQITSDDNYNASGGFFTNGGTFRKTGGGADMTRIDNITFINNASGIVEADAGTLRMPHYFTNTSGTLRLNGGKLAASSGGGVGFGPLYVTGGTVQGNGTLEQPIVTGGTLSPGVGPGLMRFSSGLDLGGSTLMIDGTNTTPGVGYDQLSVTGAVAISNCTLQVTSLPSVPVGTEFVIITNNSPGIVQGTFAGLPENATVSVGTQIFRIHYSAGNGNDVTLVKDSGSSPSPIQLFIGSYNNGLFSLSGTGQTAIAYTVQATTNFIQWTNIGSVTSSIGGSFGFTDTNAGSFRYRFYRLTN